jgi:hypothetical protein
MSTVAAVYTVAPLHSNPEGHSRRPAPSAAGRQAYGKRVWASLEKDPIVVFSETFDEAKRRDPPHQRQWVVLVVGDPRPPLGYVQNELPTQENPS